MTRIRAFLFFLGLALGASAPGTTVLAPRFEMLVDGAELIFTGQALSQRSEWRMQDGRKSIVTLVTFGVQQVHKGRAGQTVTLQFLGGTVGDITLDVAEMPRFKPGERVILFVAENGMAASPVLGFFHGRFSLRVGRDGHDEVLHHNGEPIGDVNEIGRPKSQVRVSQKRALSPDEFVGRIRQRMVSQKP